MQAVTGGTTRVAWQRAGDRAKARTTRTTGTTRRSRGQ